MNFTIFSLILMALFAASIVLSYLYVRRGQTPALQAGIYATLFNVIVVFLFSLSMGNEAFRSIINGVVFGTIFSVLTVAAASFFRRNESVGA